MGTCGKGEEKAMKKKVFAGIVLSALLTISTVGTVFAAGSSSTGNTPAAEAATQTMTWEQRAQLEMQALQAAGALSTGTEAQQVQAAVLNSGVAATGATVNGAPVAAVTTPLAPAQVQTMAAAAQTMVGPGATVLKAFDLQIPGYTGGTAQVRLAVSGVTAGMGVATLHQKHDGTMERVPSKAGNGYVDATFTSLSPVAIVVTGVSDKTGQSSALLILALSLGAGAAFFAVKTKRA